VRDHRFNAIRYFEQTGKRRARARRRLKREPDRRHVRRPARQGQAVLLRRDADHQHRIAPLAADQTVPTARCGAATSRGSCRPPAAAARPARSARPS
jgi:hypothetical protein